MRKKVELLKRDGVTLAVARPDDPETALQRGRELVAMAEDETRDFQPDMNAILGLQPYTFIGIATTIGDLIVDLDLVPVDRLETGDSFLSLAQVRSAGLVPGDRFRCIEYGIVKLGSGEYGEDEID